jgi:FemAB-related protein (PEP-CTERM system-associated)
MTMQCLQCDGEDPRWDDFVRANAQGTFFHLLDWRNVIARNFGYEPFYLYAEEGGQIQGILPLFLVKSLLFGRSLMSLPVCVYGGLVSRSQEASALLLAQAQELARRKDVSHLEIRGNPYAEDRGVSENYNSLFKRNDHHVTFLREIDAKEEVNLARIPRKQRRMIRQAQKYDLRSSMDDNRLWDCFQVYAESLRNLGTPIYSYKYFEDLKSILGSSQIVFKQNFRMKSNIIK